MPPQQLLGCVAGRLSSDTSTAPGDVYHGPRCSLARLGPVALEYRSCHWPGGSARLPECVRPWGPRPLRPVPLPPSVRVRVQCAGPLGACSPLRTPFVFRACRLLPRGCHSPVRALWVVCVCWWWFYPPSSPLFFCVLYFVFFLNGKGGSCTLQAQVLATNAAVQWCCILRCASPVHCVGSRPRGAARVF